MSYVPTKITHKDIINIVDPKRILFLDGQMPSIWWKNGDTLHYHSNCNHIIVIGLIGLLNNPSSSPNYQIVTAALIRDRNEIRKKCKTDLNSTTSATPGQP